MRGIAEKPWFVVVAAAAVLVAGALLVSSFIRTGDISVLCSPGRIYSARSDPPDLSAALLYYATSPVVPQQSRDEIRVSFDVLRSLGPCNFLVFGLGRDSLMWSAFNSGGTTVFLEEDPKWVQSVLKDAPNLRAHTVRYRTKLLEADDLLREYRSEPECMPDRAHLQGNGRCRLALGELPGEVYEREWDLVMIDAPKGYYGEAPGRMAAIYSAAVMARARKGEGDTHVFLHDVDRKVEKAFAMEFLCKKYLVKGVGRLWHFRIPSARGNRSSEEGFC